MHNYGEKCVHITNVQNFLRFIYITICDAYYFLDFWIGGTDIQQKGKFIWTKTKKPITVNGWHPGEPNNNEGSEHCISMGGHPTYRYEWNNSRCSLRFNFVCEKDAPLTWVTINH